MNVFYRLFVGLTLALPLIGCLNEAEVKSDQSSYADIPTFFGKSVYKLNIYSPAESVSVSGSCSSYIADLEWSINDGATWEDLGTHVGITAFDTDCNDSTYSFDISNISSVFTFTTDGQVEQIRVRGYSFGVATGSAVLKMTYRPGGSLPVASLSGEPSGINNTTALAISVAGAGVAEYSYKINLLGSLDCSDPTGYSGTIPVASDITDDISGFGDGDLGICVIGSDGLGTWQNMLSASSASWTKDTVAPNVTAVTRVSPIAAVDTDMNPVFEVFGTAGGDTVNLYNDDSCSSMENSVAGTAGSTYVSANVIVSNDYEFYAIVTDAAGNSNGCSGVFGSYTLDISPPGVPSALAMFVPAAAIGNDTTPQIMVTTSADDGDTISLFSDSSCTVIIGSVAASGGFAYPTSAVLSAGSYTFYANAADPLGNTSACSSANASYTLDTTPPNTPSGLTRLSPVAAVGTDTTPSITISGVAAGDIVTLYSNSICTLSVASGTSGGASIALTTGALSDGPYTFYAKSVDLAGNQSGCSTANASYTVDTVAPSTPSALARSSPTAAIGNDPTPTIEVFGVASGDIVTLYSNAACTISVGSAVSSGASVLITSSPVSEAGHTFYAKSEDLAGNQSACSVASVGYTLDVTAPSAPTNVTLSFPPATPGNDSAPQFLVDGVVSGDDVSIYSDDTCSALLGSNVAGGSTVTVIASGLSEGSYTVYADSADSVGNRSACSAASAVYTYDNTPPNMPSSLTRNSPVAAIGNDPTPTIDVGGVAAGDIVTIYLTSACAGPVGNNTASGGTVTISVTTPLSDGPYTFYAKSADLAGNQSACSVASVSYTVDTTPPAAPSSLVRNSPAAAISNDSTPTVDVGGVTAGDVVTLYSDNTCGTSVGFDTAIGASVLITTASPLSEGTYTFYAQAVDPAGNSSSCSIANVSYTYDGTPPTLSISVPSSPFVTQLVQVTFQFSESVFNFTQSDISVSHGSLSNFITVDGDTYTVDLDPGYWGDVDVSVGAGVAQDAATNPNVAEGPETFTSNNIYMIPVSSVYPTNGAKWNDYVRNNNGGTDEYDQPDVACSGAEAGTYETACIHGGEKRMVLVPGQTNCGLVSISDSLNVFDWICDDSGAWVTFYTKGLKRSMGLRDLVNATSWKNNSITVLLGATPIAMSSSSAWWTNTVTDLPDNSAITTGLGASLATVSTIYTLSANRTTRGYVINADRISVVTLPGVTLSHNNSAAFNCNYANGNTTSPNSIIIFCIPTRQFLWLEVNLVGLGTNYADIGIDASGLRFSRIQNTQLKDFRSSGGTSHDLNALVLTASSTSNLLSDLIVDGCGGGAVEFINSNWNIVRRLRSQRAYHTSFYGNILLTGSSDNRFYEFVIGNDKSDDYMAGVELNTSNNNIFVGGNMSNFNSLAGTPLSMGIYVDNLSTGNVFSQITITGMQDTGINLAQSQNNIFAHITTLNNTNNGVYFETGASRPTGNYFNSLAIANTDRGVGTTTGGSSGQNYFYNSASSNNTNWAMHNQGSGAVMITPVGYVSTNQNCSGTGLTNCNSLRVVTGSLGPAFVGAVTSDDVKNTSDVNGIQTYATINDWFNFTNLYRDWGKTLTGFSSLAATGSTTFRGACTSGNCQIGDWRVTTGSPLHNKSGNGTSDNQSFVPASSCPMEIHGNEAINAASVGKIFLESAVEVVGDLLGNENGLCESNETCIYAPNIGAYQGEMEIMANGNGDEDGICEGAELCTTDISTQPSVFYGVGTCTFTGGTVTGVTMYAWPL